MSTPVSARMLEPFAGRRPARLAPLLAAAALCAGCSDLMSHSPCRARGEVFDSPGGGYKAEVQHWSCDRGMLRAREEYTIVRLQSVSLGVGERVFRAEGAHALKVAWEAENHARIECGDCAGRVAEARESLTVASRRPDPADPSKMIDVPDEMRVSYALR